LLSGSGLRVQAVALGGPAAAEDFSERPALDMVAGREISRFSTR
jgi:hypothetical protein